MKFSMWLNEAEQQFALPNAKDFAYLACVLEKMSQEHLKFLAQNLWAQQNKDNMPNDWTFICHHMTITPNVTTSVLQEYYNYLGSTVQLQIVGFASDKDACAVIVKPNINIHVVPVIPHVTVAHSHNVKPFYSNHLLTKKDRIMHVNESTPLMSILLAVGRDGKSTWPATTIPLASKALIP
jgi:hypothetical protein